MQLLSEKVDCAVINAGDGSHEHPTQALLDALTIRRRKGKLGGLTVAICGDVLHSRVARSNIALLNAMGARVRVVAPRTLLPAAVEHLGVEVFHDMAAGLTDVDIVMMLRLQTERMHGSFVPSTREYFHFFGLDEDKLKAAKPDALIMHPGPMNRGVEIDSDVADDIDRSLIREQVEMGVAVRMACLEIIGRAAATPRRSSEGGDEPFAMSGLRRLFRNARLLDPESGRDGIGDIIVVDGRIAAIGANISAADLGPDVEVEDVGGLCLAPGLVDMRVQLREPGDEHMETIESGSRAAAAGGITTMVALPNTEPPVDDVSLVEFVARRAREAKLTKVHTYAAATKGLAGKELTEMGLLADNGALGFTDGVNAVANALVMRRALAYARTFDQLVIQHPEEPSLGGAGEVNEGEIATRLGLAGITPAAEVIMVERDLRLVEITGARYHVAHVSTAAAIEAIRQAKARGLPVTCDTAPPYFALNETAVGDYRTFAKLSPPLRSEERSPGGRRRARRRRDRRHRQRPLAAGPGFEAAAVHLGELRHRRVGDAAAAVAGALSQPPPDPDRGVAAADDRAGPHPGARGRAAGGGRAGRSRDLRPRRAMAASAPIRSARNPRTRRSTAGRCRAGSSARWSTAAPSSTASHDRDRRRGRHRLPARLDPVRADRHPARRGAATCGRSAPAVSARPTCCAPAARGWRRRPWCSTSARARSRRSSAPNGAVEPMLAASAAVLIGHMFPVWLGFHGGKGVATAFGVLIAVAWPVALAGAAVWLVVAIAFRYSSAAALAAALAVAAYADLTLGRERAMLITGDRRAGDHPPPREHPPPRGRHREPHLVHEELRPSWPPASSTRRSVSTGCASPAPRRSARSPSTPCCAGSARRAAALDAVPRLGRRGVVPATRAVAEHELAALASHRRAHAVLGRAGLSRHPRRDRGRAAGAVGARRAARF